MSQTQVKVNCTNCTLEVIQYIIPEGTNYIYCPVCDHDFEYVKEYNNIEPIESNNSVYQNLKKGI